ncbi:MAG: hypothetical protein ABEI58_01235 [Candidatus Nanohaloarchaea archaeon]
MVYERECTECGKMIDFGGEEPEELPENAIEFNGEIYCRECVKDFVEFGVGEVLDRIEQIESDLDEVRDQLGMEKHAGSEDI